MRFDGREARRRYRERLRHAAEQRDVRNARRGPLAAIGPRDLLTANRDFALLWWGGLVSMMGGWALQIGLPVYVFNTTGSTLATGLIFMAGTLPRILLGSVAGIFVDRWDRRRTLIVTNLLSCAAVLPLALVPSTGWLWLVYGVAFVQAIINRFFIPAENAFLPSVVKKEQLAAANALNALNNNLARLVGPALGGVVMGGVGLSGVVVLDAASFLVAAGCMALVQTKTAPAQADLEQTDMLAGLRGMWRAWLEGLEGLERVISDRMIRLLFLIVAAASVGEGVMAVLFIPFVTEVLRGEATAVGWLMSAQAIGGIGGGVLTSGLAGRTAPHRLLGWGGLCLGIIDLMIFNYPYFISGVLPALLLIALAGVPVSAYTRRRTGYQCARRGLRRCRHCRAYAATTLLQTGVVKIVSGGASSEPMAR